MVANAEESVSAITHQSFDFVSLNLPNTQTTKPGLTPYLVYYDAGIDVNIQLAPVSGNADLYVWYPGNRSLPDKTSLLPGTAVDQVSFTTPAAGIYIILVAALDPVIFNLSIQPAGGPNAPVTGLASQLSPQNPTAGQFLVEPIFTNGVNIGLDPLGSAQPINFVNIRLPMIQR